jgi:hypothetical protein
MKPQTSFPQESKGYTIQWPKEKKTKGQTMIYKTIHRKKSLKLPFTI